MNKFQASALSTLALGDRPKWGAELRQSLLDAGWICRRTVDPRFFITTVGCDALQAFRDEAPWGVVETWTERGLTCCCWMQLTNEGTMYDAKQFKTGADAAYYINRLGTNPFGRVFTARQLSRLDDDS